MLKGIDVSEHQGIINWDSVKPNIDFAIIRCGYGSDYTKQDDKQFERNVKECERLGIPFGVYLYSYATSETNIMSETAHALRLIGKHKPFCVYIDMEEGKTSYLGKEKLTSFAKLFCKTVKAKGFKVGVYANENWCRNYLDIDDIHTCGYSVWCAKFSTNKPNIAAEYDIWQYSSTGKVNGISGNVDMNYMYNDIRNVVPTTVKKSVDELAQEVISGKWGNGITRKQKLTQAGYDYNAVQSKVNSLLKKSSETPKKSAQEIAKEVVRGIWGNGAERKKRLEAAGYNYNEVQSIVNKLMK